MTNKLAEKTKEVISGLLKENTGGHLLDSGQAYGRNWERNQKRDFEKEEACQVTVEEHGISVYYNVYHYLVNFLEYSEELQKKFDEFANLPENKEEGWLNLMEAFAEKYAGNTIELNGKVLDVDGQWGTTNTYNHESLVSQVIQYVHLTIDGENFLLLQVHGGCDVRGGYTAPKAFSADCEDNFAYFLMAERDLNASCSGDAVKQIEGQESLDLEGKQHSRNNWYSDDCGYHWYFDGSTMDEKPAEDFWENDVENNVVRCKECGSTIYFSVTECW